MTRYHVTFEDGSEYLMHHGVKGMKWGQWSPETAARYSAEGKGASAGGGGGAVDDEEEKKSKSFLDQVREVMDTPKTPLEALGDHAKKFVNYGFNSPDFDNIRRKGRDLLDKIMGKEKPKKIVNAQTQAEAKERRRENRRQMSQQFAGKRQNSGKPHQSTMGKQATQQLFQNHMGRFGTQVVEAHKRLQKYL